jgi:tRNA (guanine-N7-)-methyltransferase
MTPAQRAWLDAGSPRLVEVPLGPGLAVAPQPRLDLGELFGRCAPLVVEIGCGHGETLASAASADPGTDFLGFEVHLASVAATLGRLAAAGVSNTRLVVADAVSGLTHLIPDHRLAEIWAFFPDPWPKSRHHKRRLVNPAFLDLAAARLVDGGLVRLATDVDPYAAVMAELFRADPRFALVSTDRFAPRPLTKFEARGLAAGRAIHDFAFRVAR